MKDYSHIVTKITSSPWLIMPESLEIILEIMDRRLSGHQFTTDEIKQRLSTNGDKIQAHARRGQGAVAVLPLTGPIFPRANMMTEMSGATSLEQFRQGFAEVMGNDNISALVLDIDSPGGLSDLIPEVGEEIRAGRDVKPIYAVANTLAGSAAYWLASQASELYVTPSGAVGSIGVYTVHEDISGAEEKQGVKTTLVHSGRFKIEGNPYEPLSEEGRQYRQRVVDVLHEDFLDAVAVGRNTNKEHVRANYGQGRMLLPVDALDVGMVDGIGTLEAVVSHAIHENSHSTPVGLAAGAGAYAAFNIVRTRAEVPSDYIEMEHSEPGSGGGGEPVPRPQVPDRGGTENNDRIDTPPDVVYKPVTGGNPNANSKTSKPKEGRMNEVLLRLAASMGLTVPEDATDETLGALIQETWVTQEAQLEPLREATAAADSRRRFRDEFPEEFERMQRLEASDRNANAKAFADRYTQFEDKDGKKSGRGFSALVLGKVEEAHKLAAQSQLNEEDLGSLLDSISNNGIVEYGELGSSLAREDTGTTSLTSGGGPRDVFAAAVAEVMEEDSLDYAAAVKVAAEKYPDEFRAYRESIPGHAPAA